MTIYSWSPEKGFRPYRQIVSSVFREAARRIEKGISWAVDPLGCLVLVSYRRFHAAGVVHELDWARRRHRRGSRLAFVPGAGSRDGAVEAAELQEGAEAAALQVLDEAVRPGHAVF